MQVKWKDSLKEPLERRSTFRFAQPFVPVSSLAQQYYCEAKVEQEYIHGEIPTEVKNVGTDLHNHIFAMEKVKLEELIEHIEKDAKLTATFGLQGKIADLDIVGIPDAVVFLKAKPTWIIELKTTRGDPSRLWTEQLVQVRIYGMLMEQMGFDCSVLKLALVRWRQDDVKNSSRQRETMLPRITNALLRGKTSGLEGKHAKKFFVFPHNPSEAIRAVEWAQDYWLEKRAAIPTDNSKKCSACEYNSLCPHSLVNNWSHTH
jgi:CRISPR/Cas system-associated exonuclease Cas4 (RecB family)